MPKVEVKNFADVSYVVITFKDGRTTKQMYMGDFLRVDSDWCVNVCAKLSQWITDLNTYKRGLETNAGYLSSLWDDAHTADIRAAITSCLQWINLGIEEYQAVLDDMTLYTNALVQTNNWVNAHPEFDRRNGYQRRHQTGGILYDAVVIYYP